MAVRFKWELAEVVERMLAIDDAAERLETATRQAELGRALREVEDAAEDLAKTARAIRLGLHVP